MLLGDRFLLSFPLFVAYEQDTVQPPLATKNAASFPRRRRRLAVIYILLLSLYLLSHENRHRHDDRPSVSRKAAKEFLK